MFWNAFQIKGLYIFRAEFEKKSFTQRDLIEKQLKAHCHEL